MLIFPFLKSPVISQLAWPTLFLKILTSLFPSFKNLTSEMVYGNRAWAYSREVNMEKYLPTI